ncbi:hypothetical protein SLA2020_399560 [Shorea laevis]
MSKVPSHTREPRRLGSRISAAYLPHGLCRNPSVVLFHFETWVFRYGQRRFRLGIRVPELDPLCFAFARERDLQRGFPNRWRPRLEFEGIAVGLGVGGRSWSSEIHQRRFASDLKNPSVDCEVEQRDLGVCGKETDREEKKEKRKREKQ